MTKNDKFILQTRLTILENALDDVLHMLIDIEMAEEGALTGVYARVAAARLVQALGHSENAGK